MSTRVVLVGARGYGAVHLERLRTRPDVDLVAVVDPAGPVPDALDAAWWPSLQAAFGAGAGADIVIIATPIGSHADLAETAMDAGCDVYLEKPPTPSWSDYQRLLLAQQRTGRTVQVGFQSLASGALPRLDELGAVTSVAAWGAWAREPAYWRRSAWAGRRELDGAPVLDGVVTNALSHAVVTALRAAGATRAEQVASVEVELLHLNDIQADDLSSLRIRLDDGRVVSAALTLCAEEQRMPMIEVRTESGDALYSYKDDVVEVDGVTTGFPPGDLLGELIEHRRSGAPLSAALVDVGAFMRVLEAVRVSAAPRQVDPAAPGVRRNGPRPVLEHAEEWMQRAARAGALFSELRAPWAPAPRTSDRVITMADAAGLATIGTWRDGSDVTATSGPRPYLHPLRTVKDVRVTDAHPVDHDWHLGVSFALQDVSGVNFWGGRTYTRGRGYRWLADHGRIVPRMIEDRAGLMRVESEWQRPDGRALLRERDVWTFRRAGDAWVFALDLTLEPTQADGALLSGPGPNGRVDAGYGGLAWRLPPVDEVHVRTPDDVGEEAVHGATADWVALTAEFPDGVATVGLAGADEETRADPWFVRVESYPAIGSALAWRDPVMLSAGDVLRRRFHGFVSDGAIDDERVRELVAQASETDT